MLPPGLDHPDPRLSRGQKEDAHAQAARHVEQHGPGFLATAGNQITSLSGKLVEWDKDHPVRMAAAATVFIAVSGLLVQVMKRKTQRVAAVRQAAKQIKKRVKSRVREAVAAVGGVVRSRGRSQSRPRLAPAGATGRVSSKSR